MYVIICLSIIYFIIFSSNIVDIMKRKYTKRKYTKRKKQKRKRTNNQYGGYGKCFMNNDALVESLPTSVDVIKIMKQVDRKHFCINIKRAYCDSPSQLMLGQTISAPHMHARALEYLLPKLTKGAKVLDVGSGSGYLVACFAEKINVNSPEVANRGSVIGLEIHPELVEFSKTRIQKYMPHLLEYPDNCLLEEGSGWHGYPAGVRKEMYDAIHVGAACDTIPPFLFTQLKKTGILVLPLRVGKGHKFCIVEKDKDNNMSILPKESVRYVPLIVKTNYTKTKPKKKSNKIIYPYINENNPKIIPQQRYPKTITQRFLTR